MSSFNPPEPYVWTCLNHWVIPDMISTPVSPLFRHLVKMIILSFPRETFDLDFCLLTLEAKTSTVTTCHGRFAHRGKNPWSLIEGWFIVELWQGSRATNLHCKTASVVLGTCEPGDVEHLLYLLPAEHTYGHALQWERRAEISCKLLAEALLTRLKTYRTSSHSMWNGLYCMLCISEPKTHHASELRK